MGVGVNRYDDGISSGTAPPAVDVWLVRRVLAGWRPRAIATASAGAVSVRTAQRWCAEIVGVEEVALGGYTATYVIRRTKPPVRVSLWRNA